MNYILGISAFYHDSAACLIREGEIVAAAQRLCLRWRMCRLLWLLLCLLCPLCPLCASLSAPVGPSSTLFGPTV